MILCHCKSGPQFDGRFGSEAPSGPGGVTSWNGGISTSGEVSGELLSGASVDSGAVVSEVSTGGDAVGNSSSKGLPEKV